MIVICSKTKKHMILHNKVYLKTINRQIKYNVLLTFRIKLINIKD